MATLPSKKALWISYDFGLKGDYTGLYRWLDQYDAIECGHGLAFLFYKTDLISDHKEFAETVKKDLNKAVKLSESDRVYIIFLDNKLKKVLGNFVSGERRQAPWIGYKKSEGISKPDISE